MKKKAPDRLAKLQALERLYGGLNISPGTSITPDMIASIEKAVQARHLVLPSIIVEMGALSGIRAHRPNGAGTPVVGTPHFIDASAFQQTAGVVFCCGMKFAVGSEPVFFSLAAVYQAFGMEPCAIDWHGGQDTFTIVLGFPGVPRASMGADRMRRFMQSSSRDYGFVNGKTNVIRSESHYHVWIPAKDWAEGNAVVLQARRSGKTHGNALLEGLLRRNENCY